MKNSKINKILISTGGTGGHVFPAYSLAKNLIKNNYEVEVVTDKRGLKFLDKYKNLKIITNSSTTLFNKNALSVFFSIFIIFFFLFKVFIDFIQIKAIINFWHGWSRIFPNLFGCKNI